MKKTFILLLIVLFLLGCPQQDTSKSCAFDTDCALILNGCLAGCWNKDFKPKGEGECQTVLPPETECICEENLCIEYYPEKQTREDENKLVPVEQDQNKELPTDQNIPEQLPPENDPCKEIICQENTKCVLGICVLKNCEELAGHKCSAKQICRAEKISSLDREICCKEECKAISGEIQVGKQPGDEVDFVRYVDEAGFLHEVPMEIPGLKITGKKGEFFSVDEGKNYYYEASVENTEIVVKNNDVLNGLKIKLESIEGDQIKINNGETLRAGRQVNIEGIDFQIIRVHADNRVSLRAGSSLMICEWRNENCFAYPQPFDKSLNHSIYLSDAAIYDSRGAHIILVGTNDRKAIYVPLISEKPWGSRFFMILDQHKSIPFRHFDGTVIEFLGTDLDGDEEIGKIDPTHHIIDSRDFVSYDQIRAASKPYHSLFKLKKEDKEEIIKLVVLSQK